MNQPIVNYDAVMSAPFGAVAVGVRGVQVAIVLLSEKQAKTLANKPASHPLAAALSEQIAHYLNNAHYDFNLPLMHKGTPFQRLVWQAISAIPRGQVLTYGEIAQQIGSGSRAVANACGANHLPLVVPCHRVVAKNGLGGFMSGQDGGLEIKKWLLKHEGIAFKNDKPIRPAAFE